MPKRVESSCQSCQTLCSQGGEKIFCQSLGPQVQRSVRTSIFEQNSPIIRSGDTPAGLYILKSGLVSLDIPTTGGSALTIRIVKPGQIFGYRALFSDENYYYDAVALEPSEACLIPKEDLQKIMNEKLSVLFSCLKQVSLDLKIADFKWLNQVSEESSVRIARTLLFLDEHFEDKRWTRREIGQIAGTTPETVMRTLADFEKKGLIEQVGRNIHISKQSEILDQAKEKKREAHRPPSPTNSF